MNKLALNITLLILAISAVAQTARFDGPKRQKDLSPLNNTWIGPAGAYLSINKNEALFSTGWSPGKYAFSANNNFFTLTSGNANTFNIIKLSKDTLVISGLDNNARALLLTPGLVTFISEDALASEPFHFQKMTYSRNGNGQIEGNYRYIEIQIDSAGSFQLSLVPEKGELKGKYTGRLQPDQLQQFSETIKNATISDFSKSSQMWSEGPEFFFHIYYNNIEKETYGQDISYLTWKLAAFLETLSDQPGLQKIPDSRTPKK